jgi:hypothetical protein
MGGFTTKLRVKQGGYGHKTAERSPSMGGLPGETGQRWEKEGQNPPSKGAKGPIAVVLVGYPQLAG